MPTQSLPEELLDHIVGFLHHETKSLKCCSLVSKSWVPRARKHLYDFVLFHTSQDMQAWRNTFPDPSRSPAFYTKRLYVDCPQVVTAADGEEDGWIPTFSRVVYLWVRAGRRDGRPGPLISISFAPLHGFSRALETLNITFTTIPSSHIFDLILSFPLLKNVAVLSHQWATHIAGIFYDRHLTPIQPRPPNPPAFTGCLELSILVGVDPIASRFLSLSGCLHFQKLHLTLHRGNDILLAAALVESCCATLESLYLSCIPIDGTLIPGLIDLSKATKLKEVAFLPDIDPKWIVWALKSITPQHRDLHYISLHTNAILHDMDPEQETTRPEWLELDSVFVGLWESHSIYPNAWHQPSQSIDGDRATEMVGNLFPETTKRGLLDLSIGSPFLEIQGC